MTFCPKFETERASEFAHPNIHGIFMEMFESAKEH